MLFDVVPDNFFMPLAARGRKAYWECICTLFRITNSELSFGIEKEYLVDELEYYFQSNMAADISDDADILGSDEADAAYSHVVTDSRYKSSAARGSAVQSGRDTGNAVRNATSVRSSAAGNTKTQSAPMSPRDKANLTLRQLERWGWIYVDTDMSYVQRVNFRDYAISVIRALSDIDKRDHPEYQGYIYTIYNQVKAGADQAGIGLLQIVDNTEALIAGLKSLNANIKKYIDTLTRYSTVAEILDALLNDYYTNIIDKAYHRLMTSDNVAKFRPAIIQGMEAFSKNKKYLDKAAEQIAEVKELSVPEAREAALSMLHSVIDAFRKMDQIIEDINKKNMKYQRAAINRARFLLSSSDDIRGQLKSIIGFICEESQNYGIDHNTVYELEQLDGLIKLFTVGFLDIDSLYSPVAGKKSFVPEPVEEIEIDEEGRNLRHLKMLEKLRNNMTPDKIDAYVLELLGDRTEIKASALRFDDIESFIKLIYIRLYSIRKNMSYVTEEVKHGQGTASLRAPAGFASDGGSGLDDRDEIKDKENADLGKFDIFSKDVVAINGYRFRDFIIRKKI